MEMMKKPGPLGFPGAKKEPMQSTAPMPKPAPEAQPKPQAGIPPEAVGFRTADEVCGNCMHYAADGACAFGMPVSGPGDSCMLFSQGDQGAADMEMPEEETA